jgi:hypothetical protein
VRYLWRHHYTTLSPARMLSHFMSMTPEWGPYTLANVPFTPFRNGIRVKTVHLFIPYHYDVWKIGDKLHVIWTSALYWDVFNFTSGQLYPCGKTWICWTIDWVSLIANLDVLTKRNIHIWTRTQIVKFLC